MQCGVEFLRKIFGSVQVGHPQASQKRHLLLGTVSFTVCFAAWGPISAFAPRFRQQFHRSATQTAFLVAVPVLLGAPARIPIGMLADRFGGRTVFTFLMFFVAAPVALVSAASSYRNLLVVAFLLESLVSGELRPGSWCETSSRA